MRTTAVIVIQASTVAVLALGGADQPLPPTESPQRLVEWFCDAEFHGLTDVRQQVAEYSAARGRLERARDPLLEGKVIFMDSDPLVAVSAYRIVSVARDGRKATAKVEFEAVACARGDGEGGRVLVECRQPDLVVYQLRCRDGVWKLVDPPELRVSLEVLTRFYEERIRQFEKDVLTRPDASDEQRASYQRAVQTLTFLQGMAPPASAVPAR